MPSVCSASTEEEAALLEYEAERQLMMQELMRMYEVQRERMYAHLQRAFLDRHRVHTRCHPSNALDISPPKVYEAEEDDEVDVRVKTCDGVLIVTLDAGRSDSWYAMALLLV